jgi:hypothetical protein
MSSPLDMLIGGGGGAGNTSVWSGGISPVTPVTDQSMHYNGGTATGNNAVAPAGAKSVMYWAAGIVIAAIVILWILGAVTFRSALR